jgi:hypothetical protein
MPCNSLTNFEFEEKFAIWQKDILTLDGLEKEQLIQLDDVTRIKLALRNQANWPRFSAILILRWETLHLTLLKLFEQKKFLSNCIKQLVTPVNLTIKFFHKLFNFQDWERAPKAKKLPFIEVISAIMVHALKFTICLNIELSMWDVDVKAYFFSRYTS